MGEGIEGYGNEGKGDKGKQSLVIKKKLLVQKEKNRTKINWPFVICSVWTHKSHSNFGSKLVQLLQWLLVMQM